MTAAIKSLGTDSGWVTIGSGASAAEYRKIGNLVQIKSYNSSTGLFDNPPQWTTKYTLPTGYRPTGSYIIGSVITGSTTTFSYVRVTPEGYVQFVGNSTANKVVAFNVVFFV